MDGKVLARLAAVIIIALAATATAVHLARDGRAPASQSSPPAATETPRADPLREMLRRCQQMGEAATREADCLDAWDDNRRRFLTPTGEN